MQLESTAEIQTLIDFLSKAPVTFSSYLTNDFQMNGIIPVKDFII